MALAAAEAAMQVRPLAGVGFQRALDQMQCLIETDRQLRGDHVRAQGFGRTVHALGQTQDEVALMDLGGDVENVADDGHSGSLSAWGRYRWWMAGSLDGTSAPSRLQK
jgi:hypothetical protein